MKILVFATDVLPLPGYPTSGTALRTHGIIQGLRAHGHTVIESVPRSALSGLKKSLDLETLDPFTKEKIKTFDNFSFDSFNQRDVVSEVNPDAIICGHWPAMTMHLKPSQPLIIDLAGPHLLERHYQKSPGQVGAVLGKLAVIATADYYIVSGQSQRLYFLSFMMRGRVENPEKRMVTIPMPLNPTLPERKGNIDGSNTYPHFVFAGVFLPWQNPQTGLEQLGETVAKKNQGRITLIGGKHPNYDIKLGGYEKLFEKLSKNPFVETLPMLPFDRFTSELSSKDVALDLMKWNLERELAVTIRTTTYLWAGVPVIYNDYADLGKLIKRYNAGWQVSPENKNALKEVIDEIYASPEVVLEKSKNAQRLAREIFSWDVAVEPLLKLFSSPERVRVQETDILIDGPDNTDLRIFSNHAVRQHFTCRINGLSRVECRVATHNLQIKKPVTFRLYQRELSASHTLITERTANEENLENNDWFSLETPPIADSAGRDYILEIAAEQTREEESISPWAMSASPYPMRKLEYGERALKNSSICLRTICLRQA